MYPLLLNRLPAPLAALLTWAWYVLVVGAVLYFGWQAPQGEFRYAVM